MKLSTIFLITSDMRQTVSLTKHHASLQKELWQSLLYTWADDNEVKKIQTNALSPLKSRDVWVGVKALLALRDHIYPNCSLLSSSPDYTKVYLSAASLNLLFSH